MSELPLPYRLPLQGIALIEASAGTGKTHTLIRIIARHVLWEGKPIEQVLAVTFTEAATAELRNRLRDFFNAVEQFFKNPSNDNDIEYLISEAPAGISEIELYLRLRQALGNIDKASVFTIHGFCQRILNEQPLLTGQSIPSPQFIENQQDIIEQICQEFWRHKNLDEVYCDALQNTWSSPASMQKMAAELLTYAKLTPERPTHLTPPDFELAFNQFKAVFQVQNSIAKPQLLLAIEQKTLNGVSHKADKTLAQFDALTNFFAQPNQSTILQLNQIAASQLKTNKNKPRPENPLFYAADQWLLFSESQLLHQQNLSLCLIHDFRVFLRQRLIELKMQRNQMSFDDLIDRLHFALQGFQGSALAAIIRESYPVALVDEFQDTDDRQWAIFKSVYEHQENTNLILIGDPKQAIYAFRGGDVHTYLSARQSAKHHASLPGNYRSNSSLITAVEGLFTNIHPHPFYEDGIDFIPVSAMKNPGQVFIGNEKIPAIQFLKIAPKSPGKSQAKSAATILCAQHCANQVAWLVNEIAKQNAQIQTENESRLLNHHDIVLLVATNKQAKLMQTCLNALSIASVCADKSSVFSSYEALDILNVLSFIAKPGGRQQQQNAAHGVLLQCLNGNDQLSTFELSTYQALLHQQGTLACFNAILAVVENAVLALPFGERRLSNYWHIVELIQQNNAHKLSAVEVLDWLCSKIERSNDNSSENNGDQPRLESGAQRIRIMTLHQSKGLEFGIVFMPFSAISKSQKMSKEKLSRYFDGNQRCIFYQVQRPDDLQLKQIQHEQDSENLRILYVGVTRAKFALFLSYGSVNQIEHCALTRVLLRDVPPSEQSIEHALHQYSEANYRPIDDQIAAPDLKVAALNYLNPNRSFFDLWRITSFSGLHQSKEQNYISPASDETHVLSPSEYNPYKGPAFGNAMHYVLEHAQAIDWQVSSVNHLNENGKLLALKALIQFGYDTKTAELGVSTLCTLVFDTLHGLLPEGINLLQIAPENIRHELEFHLSLKQANSVSVLRLLQQYAYCLNRNQLGFQKQLNGLLTGKIDLIFSHHGVFYIVDYKSNLLIDYQSNSLAESISSNEYDLQYVLYSVALHRYLKHKMGPRYSYERHFGGVRYLYSRGMQAGKHTGVFADLPAQTLIEQLDYCFDASIRKSNVA